LASVETNTMTSPFTIDVEWSSPTGAPHEVAVSTAFLEIRVGEHWATRCENEFSGSVSNRALLSAYPLALWLASSWWRLLWETGQQRVVPSVDWMLSHQLTSAGQGFLWPALLFESDGQSIEISMHPSGRAAFEPIKYLGQFRQWVTIEDVENTASTFIDKVLARLSERGVANSQLHALWAEVQKERIDPATTSFRRIEAILGFDPGEAGAEDIQRIRSLETSAGHDAAEEVAHATSSTTVSTLLAPAAVESASASAPRGKFAFKQDSVVLDQILKERHPWHRGYSLAEEFRSSCSLGETVSDTELAGLLGLKAGSFKSSAGDRQKKLPFGVAVRSKVKADEVHFLFRSPDQIRKRFEAARMIADYILAPISDSWLPTTATHTARQKTQRAFAAEFLCPSRALKSFIGDDTSDYAIEDAAQHFAVSTETVRRQIANHLQ
jgi:hypothetical protein